MAETGMRTSIYKLELVVYCYTMSKEKVELQLPSIMPVLER